MKEFNSYRDFWEFRKSVKKRDRYCFTKGVRTFLDTVIATSENRKVTLEANRCLWRAQRGHTWKPLMQGEVEVDKVPDAYGEERMFPLSDGTCEGRVNPAGISYLYLCTEEKTAMAEVRPWIGSYISLGLFITTKKIELIDCSKHHDKGFNLYLEEPSLEEKEQAVWSDIDRAFSLPVNVEDDITGYIPTQIIAELFRNEGFDGIVYKSSLAEGYNVVLFDLKLAKIVKCCLHKLEKLDFRFQQQDNPIVFKKRNNHDKTAG